MLLCRNQINFDNFPSYAPHAAIHPVCSSALPSRRSQILSPKLSAQILFRPSTFYEHFIIKTLGFTGGREKAVLDAVTFHLLD